MIVRKLIISLCLFSLALFLLHNILLKEDTVAEMSLHRPPQPSPEVFCGIKSGDLLSLITGIELVNRHFLYKVGGNSVTEHMWWYAIIGLNDSLSEPFSNKRLEGLIRYLRPTERVAEPFTKLFSFEGIRNVRNARDFFFFLTYLCDRNTIQSANNPLDYSIRRAYGSLNNPFTYYETASQFALRAEDLMASAEREVAGPGLTLYREENSGPITIIGIRSPDLKLVTPGDLLYEIDGVETSEKTTGEAIELLRGPYGTWVEMKIGRKQAEGGESIIQISLPRTTKLPEIVSSEQLDDITFLVKIHTLDSSRAGDEFLDVVEKIHSICPAADIILDLRDNHGGLISSAVSIATELIPENVILYTEDARGNRTPIHSESKRGEFLPSNVIVLVNKHTASAAEILTAALKIHGAAVVGERTYGKGVGQMRHRLPNGGLSVVTSFSVLTPELESFHEVGIEPDFTTSSFSESEIHAFATGIQFVFPEHLLTDKTLQIGYGLLEELDTKSSTSLCKA